MTQTRKVDHVDNGKVDHVDSGKHVDNGRVDYVDRGEVDRDREVRCDERGQRITNALADALAEQLAARGPGRRSLDGGGGDSPQLRVRMPRAEYDQLTAAATAEQISLSDLVRRAVRRELTSLHSAS
ncbi:MAG: hypothetical protein LBQ06_03405 [Frankiaceae bacterium]|jgi:predicted HicB family RNase H-like nuclease|nr:hypothetical protein [Frankiaceae bacterium]